MKILFLQKVNAATECATINKIKRQFDRLRFFYWLDIVKSGAGIEILIEIKTTEIETCAKTYIIICAGGQTSKRRPVSGSGVLSNTTSIKNKSNILDRGPFSKCLAPLQNHFSQFTNIYANIIIAIINYFRYKDFEKENMLYYGFLSVPT